MCVGFRWRRWHALAWLCLGALAACGGVAESGPGSGDAGGSGGSFTTGGSGGSFTTGGSGGSFATGGTTGSDASAAPGGAAGGSDMCPHCARDFFQQVRSCFNPSGQCYMSKVSSGNYGLCWDNGARFIEGTNHFEWWHSGTECMSEDAGPVSIFTLGTGDAGLVLVMSSSKTTCPDGTTYPVGEASCGSDALWAPPLGSSSCTYDPTHCSP